MDVLLPRTLEEALEMKAGRLEAMPIAGGTDVMVGVNFGHLRPAAMIDVSRLTELQSLERGDGRLFLGAGVTYARIARELRDLGPLVQASRSVGSPQIRQRGTVGGTSGLRRLQGTRFLSWPLLTPRSRWRAPPAERGAWPGVSFSSAQSAPRCSRTS